MKRGRLYVIAAPSGAGKTSLLRALMQRRPGLEFSVSCTTRKPRTGERDGKDYHFIDREAFERLRGGGRIHRTRERLRQPVWHAQERRRSGACRGP